MAEIHFPNPMVFAHRGASAYAPENTLSAFRLAADLGAQAIELDVKLTADGEVVVLHDQTLDRTTNGQGDLRHFTLAQIQKLDAGGKFDSKFAGERIPTLREVFELLGGKFIINIELTNYASPHDDLVQRVASLVKQYHLEESIIFSSFLPRNLVQIRRLCPEIPNGLLTLPGWKGWFHRLPIHFWIPFEALHPAAADVSPALVSILHQAGKRVHAWTVNDEKEMVRMFELGVDGLFSDDPKLALCVLEGNP